MAAESAKPPAIRVEAGYAFIRIFINDTLHLHLPTRKNIVVQSWRDSGTNYSIEYTLEDGRNIITEYDDAAKWRAILAGVLAAL